MSEEEVQEQESRLARLKWAFTSQRPKEDATMPATVNLVLPQTPPAAPAPPPEEKSDKKDKGKPEERGTATWTPQQAFAQNLEQGLIAHRINADRNAYETRYEARSRDNVKATVAYELHQYRELVGIEPATRRAELLADLKRAEDTMLKSELRDWLEVQIPALLQGHRRYYQTPSAMKPTPAEAMNMDVRKQLEPWQVTPEESGVLQIAATVAEAIQRKLLMILVIDASPFLGMADGKFSGVFGGGKSQLGWEILYWTYSLMGRAFDPRKDVVYRRDRDRFKRLLNEDERVPWGVDEMNQFFDERDWNRPENKPIIKEMEMYRKVGRPIVGACSSIWNLDERMRLKIITHRLEIDEWDVDTFTGSAVLFRKYGPPKLQVEEEDKWGLELERIRFAGLTHDQFEFYESCAAAAREWEEKGGLDALLKKRPDWLAEFVQKPPLLPELGGNAQIVQVPAQASPVPPAGEPQG